MFDAKIIDGKSEKKQNQGSKSSENSIGIF